MFSDDVVRKYIDSVGIVFQYSIISGEKVLYICWIGGIGGDVFLSAAGVVFWLFVFCGADSRSECVE
jgi:hypothetical protein